MTEQGVDRWVEGMFFEKFLGTQYTAIGQQHCFLLGSRLEPKNFHLHSSPLWDQ